MIIPLEKLIVSQLTEKLRILYNPKVHYPVHSSL